jgi:hypothetical protein
VAGRSSSRAHIEVCDNVVWQETALVRENPGITALQQSRLRLMAHDSERLNHVADVLRVDLVWRVLQLLPQHILQKLGKCGARAPTHH